MRQVEQILELARVVGAVEQELAVSRCEGEAALDVLVPVEGVALVARVLRMIRPGIQVQSDGSAALWDAGEGQITDAAPVCPPSMSPAGSLVWSDGSASGYSIDPLPPAGAVMSLDISVP